MKKFILILMLAFAFIGSYASPKEVPRPQDEFINVQSQSLDNSIAIVADNYFTVETPAIQTGVVSNDCLVMNYFSTITSYSWLYVDSYTKAHDIKYSIPKTQPGNGGIYLMLDKLLPSKTVTILSV